MSDPGSGERPARRKRYRGANPRRFAEKYKELQPDRFPDDVAKVIAGGKTVAGSHRAIMVPEVLEVLRPSPGQVAVDCTLGYGGHAGAILRAIQPGGRLIALDVDPIEGSKAEARLRALGFPEDSLVIHHRNFAGLVALLASEASGGADLILADLGLSSMQIDDPSRGFTWQEDGPLDMRMDPTRGRPGSEWLESISEVALARSLAENADEPQAGEVAAAIARNRTPLRTTRGLATLIRSVYARSPTDEATAAVRRVFQAIRIAVNDEFAALDALLRTLPVCLAPGGRVALLTFHSGEDRRVKRAFKEGYETGLYEAISPEVIRATAAERRANPRSTSAKLRFAIRSGT